MNYYRGLFKMQYKSKAVFAGMVRDALIREQAKEELLEKQRQIEAQAKASAQPSRRSWGF